MKRGDKVWEVEDTEGIRGADGGAVVGQGTGGCYFLALGALAEFRGGVTGRPDPRPPPPPYAYSFLSAGFRI